MLKRFTELVVAQRAAADETIDKFKDDVDSFCADADEWAHQYIDTAADLAVEELVAKGCLDVDRDTFVNDYLNSYLWDKRIKELRALASALREEEEEREARRQNRTESARHLFEDDYDDEKMMNLASAGVSGLFNMIGRGMSNAEMSGKIKALTSDAKATSSALEGSTGRFSLNFISRSAPVTVISSAAISTLFIIQETVLRSCFEIIRKVPWKDSVRRYPATTRQSSFRHLKYQEPESVRQNTPLRWKSLPAPRTQQERVHPPSTPPL